MAVKCADSFNGEDHQILCSLDLVEGAPGVACHFEAFHHTIWFDNPDKKIRISGNHTVFIAGDLLRRGD